LTVLYSSASC